MSATAASANSVAEGITDVGKRRIATVAVALSTLLVILDGTIANVALPTIARDLHVSNAASIWVVNAFNLVVTMTLFSAAALGDIIGYAMLFRIGLAIFTVASLGCALSHSLEALVAMRVVQGVGASCVMAIAPALYRSIYPPAMLGRALGLSATVVALSASAGPAVGGAILGGLSWPWLFIVNVPIGTLALIWSARTLPTIRPDRSLRSFDVPSALAAAIFFGALIYGLDGIARRATELVIAAEVTIGIVAGIVFVRRSLGLSSPLLPVDLFRRPIFSLAAATSVCTYAAQGLAYVGLPFFFQSALGVDPFHAGMLLTAWPLAVVAAAPLAGRLTERYSTAVLATIGLTVMAIGLGMWATVGPHPTLVEIVVRGVICGLGFGFFQTPNNRQLLSSAPRERSGSASGVLASARLLGQTLGAAATAILFSIVAQRLGGTFNGSEVYAGVVVVMWASCACAAVAAGVSAFRFGDDRGASDESRARQSHRA
jgi:DHA2 family multidrug resistance protein-like MFS transporter